MIIEEPWLSEVVGRNKFLDTFWGARRVSAVIVVDAKCWHPGWAGSEYNVRHLKTVSVRVFPEAS